MASKVAAQTEPISFTQYIMPDGRRVEVTIYRPPDVAEKARAVMAAGLSFEVELLSDRRTVSLTVADREEGEDLEIELVLNGPRVPEAVDRLVEKAHKRLATRHTEEGDDGR